MESNKWHFQDGDIVLSSDDPEQLQLANQWILGLTQAIRAQVMEEIEHGRTNISDQTGTTDTNYKYGYQQPELPEVPC